MRREAQPFNAEQYSHWIRFLRSDHWILDRVPQGVLCSIWSMSVCGLRVGESAELSRSWFQEGAQGAEITVPKDNGEGWTPKTKSGFRSVPVPEKMEDHHTGETVQIPAERLMRAYFVGSETVNRNAPTVRAWFYKMAIQTDLGDLGLGYVDTTIAGSKGGQTTIPDVMPHDLRASWCVQCLRSNVNRYTVRDWGGWKKSDMVDHYARFVGDPSGKERSKF